MKYSLKNRQFRKKNTIFGDRKKQQPSSTPTNIEHPQLPLDIQQDLQTIKESWGQSEQSITIDYQNERKNKLYQFINFRDKSPQRGNSRSKEKIKKGSVEAKHNRHCLDPATKPILDNPDIRLTQSQENIPKRMEINSQTVYFCYRPKELPNQNNQLFALFKKLYTLFIKNNQRIDQLQAILSQVIFRDQLVAKQLNQGLRTALNIQQQTNLFVNTMRSVYQNLRVCRLKQDNLQLYFKQKQHPTQSHSLVKDQDEVFNNMTVKYGQPKISLLNKQFESQISQTQKQSKQLADLIDYESDCSFSEIVNEKYYKSIDFPQGFKKNQCQPIYKPLLQPLKLDQSIESNQNYEQFSPFEANRMMSVHQSHNSMKQSQTFPVKTSYHSQFSTFRSPTHAQNNSQQILFKRWLQNSNQINLKCWLDDTGCLRRVNNTYIFNDQGQVITMSPDVYGRMVSEGKLLPVFEQ